MVIFHVLLLNLSNFQGKFYIFSVILQNIICNLTKQGNLENLINFFLKVTVFFFFTVYIYMLRTNTSSDTHTVSIVSREVELSLLSAQERWSG